MKLKTLFVSLSWCFSLSLLAIGVGAGTNSLSFTQQPFVGEIETTYFSLNFETNAPCFAVVQYGLTADYELGKVEPESLSMTHSIAIEGLEAGQIYYAKIYGFDAANDTTPIFCGVYCTASHSLGAMNVTFVKPFVLNTPNTVVDSFIYYIGKATQTLDIALYDLTNHASQSDDINLSIIEAINQRYDAGVVVRFITDGSMANTALNSLNEDIPVLAADTDGNMRNKFLLIDRESVDNAWVLSGSTNWSYNDLMMNFNDLIAIQDQTLAKAYTLEFNEMWGDSTLQPNLTHSVFGKDKIDNTPHVFRVAGERVELYFSPTDATAEHITTVLNSAKTSIDFAMTSFTDNSLAVAINNANNRGLLVTGVIDYVEELGSEYDYLKRQSVDVADFVNADNSVWPDGMTCHHKFCVVDVGSDDAVTVTGSYNWTPLISGSRDENTLIIYSTALSAKYNEEMKIIEANTVHTSASKTVESSKSLLMVVPNPSCGSFEISNYGVGFNHLKVINSSGKVVKESNLDGDSSRVNLNNKGLYVILLSGKNDFAVKKVLVK